MATFVLMGTDKMETQSVAHSEEERIFVNATTKAPLLLDEKAHWQENNTVE